jgi:hypothetical protein
MVYYSKTTLFSVLKSELDKLTKTKAQSNWLLSQNRRDNGVARWSEIQKLK